MAIKTKKSIKFSPEREVEKVDWSNNALYHFMVVPFQWESLMSFGKIHNDYGMVFGIGMVKRIIRTDKNYDLVYMNFGRKDRAVIVWEYNARKQLVTLSRNKYAIFYGFSKGIKIKQGRKLVLYARALQGLYVPTAFDVKKKYKDFVFDKADDQEKDFEDFLKDIQEIKDE